MPKIVEMFAFVVADEDDDDEGVMGFCPMGSSVMFPMVGADMERVEQLRPWADEVAERTGKPYVVKRFEYVGDL